MRPSLTRKLPRNEDAHLADRAPARTAAAHAGHAELGDLDGIAVLGASRNLERDSLVGHDAGNLDGAAERSLSDGDVDRADEVVAGALEALVFGNSDAYEQVAGCLAAEPRLAIAAHAQLLP